MIFCKREKEGENVMFTAGFNLILKYVQEKGRYREREAEILRYLENYTPYF